MNSLKDFENQQYNGCTKIQRTKTHKGSLELKMSKYLLTEKLVILSKIFRVENTEALNFIIPVRALALLQDALSFVFTSKGQNVIFPSKTKRKPNGKTAKIWLNKQWEFQCFYLQHPQPLNKAKILSISLTDKEPQRSRVTCPKAGMWLG